MGMSDWTTVSGLSSSMFPVLMRNTLLHLCDVCFVSPLIFGHLLDFCFAPIRFTFIWLPLNITVYWAFNPLKVNFSGNWLVFNNSRSQNTAYGFPLTTSKSNFPIPNLCFPVFRSNDDAQSNVDQD